MEISVFLDNIGYQKPIDILIRGIKNIKYVDVQPYSNPEVTGVEETPIVCNSENCEYVFVEEIVDYSKDSQNKEGETEPSKTDDDIMFSIGHIQINKLKIPNNCKEWIIIPFLANVGYEDDGGNKSGCKIQFNICIETSTVTDQVELPLYYRPFYFNSVLLLTPFSLTPNYNYDIKEIHKKSKNEGGANTEMGTKASEIYNITIENEKKTRAVGTGLGGTVVPTHGYDKVSGRYQNFQTLPVSFNETEVQVGGTPTGYEYTTEILFKDADIPTNMGILPDDLNRYKIKFVIRTNTLKTIKSQSILIYNMYGTGKEGGTFECNSNNSEEVKTYSMGKISNKRYEMDIKLKCDNVGTNDKYDGETTKYIISIGVREITITTYSGSEMKNKCYGRLFYSIANGCSIGERIGEKSIYELNNVTLSYINGSESGNMVVKSPFRCFSEMEGSEEGEMKSKDVSGLTKKMMYGITEPFIDNDMRMSSNAERMETVYVVSENGDNKEEKIEIYSGGVDMGNTITLIKNWTHYPHINGKLMEDEKIEYRIGWVYSGKNCKQSGGGGIKQRRYKTNIRIDRKGVKDTEFKPYLKIGIDEESEYAFKKLDVLDYRRTSTSGNVTFKKSGGNELDITWYIKYECHKARTGEATLTVWGEYEDRYSLNNLIERGGLPCINLVSEKGKEDEIDVQIYSGKFADYESAKSMDIGVKDIYGVYRDDSFHIDYIQKYRINNGVYNNKIDKHITPLIFDTKEWLDISFSVEEGHPEDEFNFSTRFVGFNDVKFYDDILWEIVTGSDDKEYPGIHTKGYSSSNVRYFALAPNKNGGTLSYDDKDIYGENEILTFLHNLYGIGVNSDQSERNRYDGVNICDYIYLDNDNYPYTKKSGWKSIHSFFKGSGGTDVWLSGRSNGYSHSCIEVTDILKSLRQSSNYMTVTDLWGCGGGTRSRLFVIGICDNYTHLDNDAYNKEVKEPYSIIKPHTDRFAVIRLYKIDKP